ncbi:MAG TPA: glycosyltransferase [Thermoleophilaceae bacterium]|nr:glycosyltransferase [Thermoleophilaceae bacterium]
MRAHLARTETFVHNQIMRLRRYRPVVAAHHRRQPVDFPLGDGLIAVEALRGPLAATERAAYRGARVALPPANSVLARYLEAEQARLLHFHYLTDARFLLGVQRRLRLPALVSGYGYDVSSFPRKLHGLGTRYLRPIFSAMDLFLAMSADMADDIAALGCPPEKIRVHYYGSDTARFRHPERSYEPVEAPNVLCCARLHPAKGVHLVLEALREVERRSALGFRLTIVGEGPARGELERLAAGYGWADRVTFTGHLPHGAEQLVEQFRRADLFAHPSLTLNGLKEGIPGTIVEAMAAGLPVVATRHAGIPAVIEDERQGLLVPEHDREALAAALERLLSDHARRRRLGEAAADRARSELDLEPRTRELERIYDGLT